MTETMETTATAVTSDNTVATNLFERATRLKLRYATDYGYITTEDLWDLPLTLRVGVRSERVCLDDIAKGLRRELRETEDESFVTKPGKGNERLELAFEVVKHVIAVRLAEAELAKTARERAEKKQKLLGVLARKQDQKLETLTEAEIAAEIEAL
jgi:hypothetical protein